MKKILAMLLCALLALGCVAALAEGELVGVSMPTKDLQRWNQDGAYMEEKLKEAESREADLSREIEEKDGQIRTIQTEAEDLRRRAEADQQKIEDLQRERDEAQKEAQSFTRSIFGFYRKR